MIRWLFTSACSHLSMFFVDFQTFFSSPVFFSAKPDGETPGETWRNWWRICGPFISTASWSHWGWITGEAKGETIPKFGPLFQFLVDPWEYWYIYIYLYLYIYLNYICCICNIVIYSYISRFVRFGSAFVFMDRLVDIFFVFCRHLRTPFRTSGFSLEYWQSYFCDATIWIASFIC